MSTFKVNLSTEIHAANNIACPGSALRNFREYVCTIHWFNAVTVAMASAPANLIVLTLHRLDALIIVSGGEGITRQDIVTSRAKQCKSYFWLKSCTLAFIFI